MADDLLLVDVFEDVRRVDEEVDRPAESHGEEDEELKAVDHQSNILPVLLHLMEGTNRDYDSD